jgi:hypothetical protein
MRFWLIPSLGYIDLNDVFDSFRYALSDEGQVVSGIADSDGLKVAPRC